MMDAKEIFLKRTYQQQTNYITIYKRSKKWIPLNPNEKIFPTKNRWKKNLVDSIWCLTHGKES
jgi:hypothetical protein